MKRFQIASTLGVALILFAALLSACAPKATYYNISDEFTATVNGQTIPGPMPWIYPTENYTIYLSLSQKGIGYEIENIGEETIKIDYDNSIIVEPDYGSVRAIPGTASYASKNNPQPSTLVASKSTATGFIIAASNLQFSDRVYIQDMFRFPLRSPTEVRLLLAISIGEEAQELNAVFTGRITPTQE